MKNNENTPKQTAEVIPIYHLVMKKIRSEIEAINREIEGLEERKRLLLKKIFPDNES